MSQHIALTFDDGPSMVTSSILDILEKEGVKATFFVVGNNIHDDSAHILRRAVRMGCEIANHSLTHSDMTTLTAERIHSELEITSERIRRYAGREARFFRPPFFSVNSGMYANIDLPIICGSDIRDWDSNTDSTQRVNNVLKAAFDGAIILMHDFAGNYMTVRALEEIIHSLRNLDYQFMTLSELFDSAGITPERGRIINSVRYDYA